MLGATLATVGLAGLTWAIVAAPGRGLDAAVIGAGGVGLAALIGFFLVEARIPDPMLPLDVFRSRQFSAANALTFVVYAALGVVFFLLVVYLQRVLGYTPVQAGAAEIPITLLLLSACCTSRPPLRGGKPTLAPGARPRIHMMRACAPDG